METGAFGWKFHDEMQPILDTYDRQMEDIKRNGAEGQLAQMQAQEDALGITTGEVAGTAVPRAGDDGLIPLAGPPRGYGDDPNLRLTQLPQAMVDGPTGATAGAESAPKFGQGSREPDPLASQNERLPTVQPTGSAGNGVRWGQLGKGAFLTAGGGLAATTGVTLCSTTGVGCMAGAPLAVFGANDAVQGAIMMNDAWHGRSSQGYNPLKSKLESLYPQWGDFIYDGGEAISALGSLGAKAPLIVDPAVTGINKTRSLFGVAVPRIDNSVRVPIAGKILDSNAQRGILGVAIGAKAYQAGKDYPED